MLFLGYIRKHFHCYLSIFAIFLFSCQRIKYGTILRQVTIYDGTGKPAFTGDIAINRDTIAAVGDLSRFDAAHFIDGNGLAVAPGFIDTHSHHDRMLLDAPDALAVVSQGVTTIVVGQDGSSHFPLKKYIELLADSPVAVNVASYSGHNTIRELVMGNDFKRCATPEEIEKMKTMLRQDLEAGALGLSTGLEYDPGIYSNRDEVLSLSKVLKPFHGRYISHLRSEDRYFWDALDEIIKIGQTSKVPVQISHFKLAMKSLWGKADSAIQILDNARGNGIDITADIYPYPYWSSDVRVLFPNRNFADEKESALILREVTSPDGIIFSDYEPAPHYNGRSLAAVASLEKMSSEKMLIEVVSRLEACDREKGNCSGSIVATSMDENDIVQLMRWSHTNICSDGAIEGLHPRGFGAFTRILGFYVRENRVLSLEHAIQKMTTLSAKNLGIIKRGRIAPGFFADLVMFDRRSVKDNATITHPQAMSSGIIKVWVNGVEVFSDNTTSKRYPGRVIRRE